MGTTLDKGSRYIEEDDGDINASIFVKYDRILHGQERRRGKKPKNERLTIKFLKKYIHYAKNRIQPKLTDEVSFAFINGHFICRKALTFVQCRDILV